MCGIAGAIGLREPLGPGGGETLARMMGLLVHRGPHGDGALADERVAFGNTRLRVMDLSARADLPMRSEDGRLWLAYNGEVTNFRELRADLERGRPFRTGSDAEVVLRLYEAEGPRLLERLTGMFALAIYDRPARRITLARDFFGLRPLFYAARADALYFASEIKALLEVPGLPRALDEAAIAEYFSLGYVAGARTPFAAIRELEGGDLLEIDLARGRWSARAYYRPRFAPRRDWDVREAAAALRGALRDSVERNLDADAPVGLTLSGGVDTSSLLALAGELGRSRELHAFSIRIAEPSFDESRYQRLIAGAIPCRHHTITVGPREVLAELERHMAFLDEPSVDGAAIPLFLLAREAGRHVSVLLSGEGGDEIFNAYETHRAFKARGWYRALPGPLRAALRAAARGLPTSYAKLSADFLAKRFTEGAEGSVPESHFYWRHVFSDEEKARLLRGLRPLAPGHRLFSEAYEALDFPDPLDRLAYLDLRYYLIDDLMVKNDRMAMAHSVETRYPYLDRRVVELALSIPSDMKLRGFSGRYVQKRAMRNLLPAPILRRKNMGLEMPHSRWFLGALRETAERYFDPRNVARTGLLDPSAVGEFWRLHAAGRKDYGRPLWSVLTFLVWFDLFVDRADYKRHLPPARRVRPAPLGAPA